MKDLGGTLARLSEKNKKGNELHVHVGREAQREESAKTIARIEKESSKFRKLELLVFNGEGSLGWFFRVERYFHINSIDEAEKLEAVVGCLKGRALKWYQ